MRIFVILVFLRSCFTLPDLLNISLAINSTYPKIGDIINRKYHILQKVDDLGQALDFYHEYEYSIDNHLKIQNKLPSPHDFTAVQVLNELHTSRFDTLLNNDTYILNENIFKGGHGDIWRAQSVSTEGLIDPSQSLILKRMSIRDKPEILNCALREVYFGELLNSFGLKSIFSRLIDHFEFSGNYWLVFRYDGISLQKLLYAMNYADHIALLEPSLIWKRLRTSDLGHYSIKGLMRQLVLGVSVLHSKGVVHRDIKPSNLLLNSEDGDTVHLLISDFSSAVDEGSLPLYGSRGPSTREESPEYAPPEVLISSPLLRGDFDPVFTDLDLGIPFDPSHPSSYDIWSVGVVFLELLLGTPLPFSADQRTASLVRQKLINHRVKKHKQGWNEDLDRSFQRDLSDSLFLSALSEFCIYIDQYSYSPPSPDRSEASLATEEDLIAAEKEKESYSYSSTRARELRKILSPRQRSQTCSLKIALLRRDPLGIGFNDQWGLDLLSKLLSWDPSRRISMKEALDHAYFVGPYQSPVDGSLHPTRSEMEIHDSLLGNTQQLTQPTQNSIVLSPHQPLQAVAFLPSQSCQPAIDTLIGWHQLTLNPQFQVRPHVSDFSVTHCPSSLHLDPQPALQIPPDPSSEIEFLCPKCGRKFLGNWDACQKHVTQRRHGPSCIFDYNLALKLNLLPPCVSEHSLLPPHPQSGWCDLQGRRRYIEDMHSVFFHQRFQYFGVFDGHFGSRAARFTASHLHKLISKQIFIPNDNSDGLSSPPSSLLLSTLNPDLDWSRLIHLTSDTELAQSSLFNHNITFNDLRSRVSQAFLDLNGLLLDQRRGPLLDRSGTTAAIALVFSDLLVVANVGDSREIICCDERHRPVQLTVDHTAHQQQERDKVLASGGWVDRSSGVWRVNGKLAVTRSLGDRELSSVLSSTPDVLVLSLRSVPPLNEDWLVSGPCLDYRHSIRQWEEYLCRVEGDDDCQSVLWLRPQLFLIIASDGVWDVMTNEQSTDIVCSSLSQDMPQFSSPSPSPSSSDSLSYPYPLFAFQRAAARLSHEALVRGSTDNIGSCVVDLLVPLPSLL